MPWYRKLRDGCSVIPVFTRAVVGSPHSRGFSFISAESVGCPSEAHALGPAARRAVPFPLRDRQTGRELYFPSPPGVVCNHCGSVNKYGRDTAFLGVHSLGTLVFTQAGTVGIETGGFFFTHHPFDRTARHLPHSHRCVRGPQAEFIR